MLGNNIYFVEFEKNEVMSGKLIGLFIGSSGYIMCTIDCDNTPCQTYQAYCFENKEDADCFLENNKALYAEKKKIADTANAKIEKINLQLLGNPEVL